MSHHGDIDDALRAWREYWQWDEAFAAQARAAEAWAEMFPPLPDIPPRPVRRLAPRHLRGWAVDWVDPLTARRLRPAARLLAADLASRLRQSLEFLSPACALKSWLRSGCYSKGEHLWLVYMSVSFGTPIEEPAPRGTPARVIDLVQRVAAASDRGDVAQFPALAAEAEQLGHDRPIWRVVDV